MRPVNRFGCLLVDIILPERLYKKSVPTKFIATFMKTQSTMSMTYLWFQSLVGTQEKDEVDVNKYKNECMGTKNVYVLTKKR